jgi:hypothetical protein
METLIEREFEASILTLRGLDADQGGFSIYKEQNLTKHPDLSTKLAALKVIVAVYAHEEEALERLKDGPEYPQKEAELNALRLQLKNQWLDFYCDAMGKSEISEPIMVNFNPLLMTMFASLGVELPTHEMNSPAYLSQPGFMMVACMLDVPVILFEHRTHSDGERYAKVTSVTQASVPKPPVKVLYSGQHYTLVEFPTTVE